jgi:hypothetical protein
VTLTANEPEHLRRYDMRPMRCLCRDDDDRRRSRLERHQH